MTKEWINHDGRQFYSAIPEVERQPPSPVTGRSPEYDGEIDGCTIYIGVQSSQMVEPVLEGLRDYNHNIKSIVDDGVESFSTLLNNCIRDCPTDIMIFCSHKVRPTQGDIKRIVDLINSGYGYVGLYRFACFGIHKKVIDKVGYLDEGFAGGGYEDDDFRIRLDRANIGFYEDHSVLYVSSESTWPHVFFAENHWKSKYTLDPGHQVIICYFLDSTPTGMVYSDIELRPKKETVRMSNITTHYATNRLYDCKQYYMNPQHIMERIDHE